MASELRASCSAEPRVSTEAKFVRLARPSIRFPFDIQKLVNALAFFSRSGIRDLTKLKAAKLLYFADKYHLLHYGRPIVGDVYYCLANGPVPSASLDIMNDSIEELETPVPPHNPIRNLFDSYLRVNKSGRFPTFEAKTDFDEKVLSTSELEALKETVKRYGKKSSWDLVQLTHQEPTWTVPNEGRPEEGRAEIPYQLFFQGAPEKAQELLALIEAEQEDRDLANSLNS